MICSVTVKQQIDFPSLAHFLPPGSRQEAAERLVSFLSRQTPWSLQYLQVLPLPPSRWYYHALNTICDPGERLKSTQHLPLILSVSGYRNVRLHRRQSGRAQLLQGSADQHPAQGQPWLVERRNQWGHGPTADQLREDDDRIRPQPAMWVNLDLFI